MLESVVLDIIGKYAERRAAEAQLRKAFVDLLVENPDRMDEIEKFWKDRKDEIEKQLAAKPDEGCYLCYKYTCVFCGAKFVMAKNRARIGFCDNCGFTVTNLIDKYLMRYGISFRDVRDLLVQSRKKLVRFVIGSDLGMIATAIAYNYYSRDFRKARKILNSCGKKAHRKIRMIINELFGKNLCLNDCIINLFIEKVDGKLSEKEMDLGIRILKRIGEKTLLTPAVAASVLYLVGNMEQKEIADLFGVTEMAMRRNIRKYSIFAFFSEKAADMGLSEDQIAAGVEMMKRIGEEHSLTKSVVAAVLCILGKDINEVAEALGVSKLSVRQNIKKLGVCLNYESKV